MLVITSSQTTAGIDMNIQFFEDPGLLKVSCAEPFSLIDLMEQLLAMRKKMPGSSIDVPTFFDLRDVSLLKLETHEFRSFIRARKRIKTSLSINPIVFLVGDMGSYGMMRMYSVYAEIDDLRAEEMCLVTDDSTEAVKWLAGKMGNHDLVRDLSWKLIDLAPPSPIPT